MKKLIFVAILTVLASCNNPPVPPPPPVPVPNPGGMFTLTGKKKNVIKVMVKPGTKLTVEEAKRQLGMALNMLDTY